MQDKRVPNPTGKGGFTGGNDPRRNNAGQRSKAAVAMTAQLRDTIVKVLAEPINKRPSPKMNNAEFIVRRTVQEARAGKPWAVKELYDRVMGKPEQPITGADGGAFECLIRYASENPNTS